MNEKDVSVVDKLASSDIEDDVPVTDILTSSEDDAPAEVYKTNFQLFYEI